MEINNTTVMVTITAITSIASFHRPRTPCDELPPWSKYYNVAAHQAGFNTVNPVG